MRPAPLWFNFFPGRIPLWLRCPLRLSHGLTGEVSGTLGGCLDFRAGDFCLLIRVRQRLNNFLSTVCVGENFGTYLWIFLRKSHKAPLRNSPLHTDSAQKIVPTLPNMNRVRRQKLRPKILRPDNGPAHFPVRPYERRRGHRSQRGMRPGRLWSHRGAGGKG